MKKAKSMRAVCQSSKIVDNNVNQSCLLQQQIRLNSAVLAL